MATDLADLHLADLHERAADAGISGYRLMRREELIAALSGEGEAKAEPEATDPPEAEPEQEPKRRRRSRRRRKPEPEPDTDEMAVVEATVLDDEAEQPVELDPSGAP